MIQRDTTLQRWADINTIRNWVFPIDWQKQLQQRMLSILILARFWWRQTRRSSRELARQIEDAGVEFVMAYGKDDGSRVTKVIGNKFVALNQYVEFDTTNLKVADKVFYPVLMEILEQCQDEDEIKEMLVARKHDLSPKHILMEDIIASVSYILNLNYGVGNTDDIDHLGNRRLRNCRRAFCRISSELVSPEWKGSSKRE